MSKKYHLGINGPSVCKAVKGKCPFGSADDHYRSENEARAAYESSRASFLPAIQKALPATEVELQPMPMGGGSYIGSLVDKHTVEPFLALFRQEVGRNAAEMEEAKAARDRGYHYHATVVSPPELKKLGKNYSPIPPQPSLRYLGLGRAVDGDNEAWFIVCESAEIAAWRQANGLPPKDLHITLAFRNKDVHTKPKGKESLVIV